jgi:hypothetical protein
MWASDFADAGLHTPCTPKPILQFAPQQPDAAPQVAGVLVKYQDGRESLAFVFDCSDHSTTCMLLGHLSLGWMLQGLVPGERRALLTVQLGECRTHGWVGHRVVCVPARAPAGLDGKLVSACAPTSDANFGRGSARNVFCRSGDRAGSVPQSTPSHTPYGRGSRSTKSVTPAHLFPLHPPPIVNRLPPHPRRLPADHLF